MSARRVQVIGIGSGSPGDLTGHAVAAMRATDVFLVADKGAAAGELQALRHGLCDAFLTEGTYRMVQVPDPPRGSDADRAGSAYTRGVTDWHAARVDRYAEILAALPTDATVGFLVWGDPAFYDSTIRIVDALADRMPLDVRVVPGITAFQSLAAAHRIVLHAIGAPVHITTGRRLLEEWSPSLGTVVVMLDGHLVCRELSSAATDLTIHWGAYLGMHQEALRSGPLVDVMPELIELRARLRDEYGWVMDTYALTPTR